MAKLSFEIKNQKLIVKSELDKIVEGSIDYLDFSCVASQDWNGMAKKFVFTYKDITKEVLEMEHFVVPPEVIKAPGFTISVIGGEEPTDNAGGVIDPLSQMNQRITTDEVAVQVYPSGKITIETVIDEAWSRKIENLLIHIHRDALVAKSQSADAALQAAMALVATENLPIVDLLYNPESENAQSGKAVADALADYEVILQDGNEFIFNGGRPGEKIEFGIAVDEHLSPNSINPVQNKVIHKVLSSQNGEIANLTTKVSGLDLQVQTTFISLEEEIADFSLQVEEVQNEFSETVSLVSEIKDLATTLSSKTDYYDTMMDSQNGKIDTLNTSISEINITLASLNEKDEEFLTAQSSLVTNVSNLNTTISTLEEDLESIEDFLYNESTGISAKVKILENDMLDQKETTVDLQNRVTQIENGETQIDFEIINIPWTEITTDLNSNFKTVSRKESDGNTYTYDFAYSVYGRMVNIKGGLEVAKTFTVTGNYAYGIDTYIGSIPQEFAFSSPLTFLVSFTNSSGVSGEVVLWIYPSGKISFTRLRSSFETKHRTTFNEGDTFIFSISYLLPTTTSEEATE